MSTVTVPRSDVTVEEVSAVLRAKLGAGYRVTPGSSSEGFGREVPGDDSTILIKGKAGRADVRLRPGTESTEIQVTPGASYPGLIRLFEQLGIARKVRDALKNAPELARPGS